MEYVNGSKAARGRNETFDGRHGRVTEGLTAASGAEPACIMECRGFVALANVARLPLRAWSLNP